jgi:hypothetical protein
MEPRDRKTSARCQKQGNVRAGRPCGVAAPGLIPEVSVAQVVDRLRASSGGAGEGVPVAQPARNCHLTRRAARHKLHTSTPRYNAGSQAMEVAIKRLEVQRLLTDRLHVRGLLFSRGLCAQATASTVTASTPVFMRHASSGLVRRELVLIVKGQLRVVVACALTIAKQTPNCTFWHD